MGTEILGGPLPPFIFSRDLIFSQLQDHQGQKGQKVQNVGNALKHMQNKKFLRNPTLSQCFHVFCTQQVSVQERVGT